MGDKVILTCAVTGAGDVRANPAIPITPAEIAAAAIEAAKAGACVAHIHVRDLTTGTPSTELDLYREVVDRIRDSPVDLVINLTTGPGAFFVPDPRDPTRAGPGSGILSPERRIEHIVALKPDICSLDVGSFNYGSGVLMNATPHIEVMARAAQEAGVVVEIEVFDTGQIALARDLLARGVIGADALFQIVVNFPGGAAGCSEAIMHMQHLLPPESHWSAVGMTNWQFKTVAQAVLLGGSCRVGLEDTIYIDERTLAPSNTALVEKAVSIIRTLGADVASAPEARRILGIGAAALPMSAVGGRQQ